MKKVYTLLGAVLLTGGLSAQTQQGPVTPINHNVHAKGTQAISSKHVNHAAAKGTPIYSNDLSASGDWTINNDAGNNDDWVIGTTVPSGAFAIAGIMSTTAGNGFGMFDSDLLCSGSQDANLQITNSIDLSLNPNVKFEFEQYYRRYQNSTYVEISTDGSTWTQFEVNAGFAVNEASATNSELVSINVSGATQSSATVWFRFKYVGGCDYAWMVDDINIFDAPADDLTLSNTTYASATQDWYSGNYITYHNYPVNQISPINFGGEICNVGSAAQTAIFLDVTIPSDAYAATSPSPMLNPGMCDSNAIEGAFGWTPTTVVNSHAIDFGITYANVATEATPANNAASATVAVSNGVYETYPNDWAGSGLWNGDDGNGNSTAFEMGNVYQVLNDDSIEAISVIFSSNTIDQVIAYAVLYELDSVTGDFVYTEQSADITLSAADLAATGPNPARVYFPITKTFAGAGSEWLVVVGHYGGPDEMIVANANGPVADQTVFLLDGSDNTWYYMTSNPMVGMIMTGNNLGIGVDENAANGITLGQNMPNPFTTSTTINYEIATAGNVNFEVYDITGKKVVEIAEGTQSAGSHTIQMNTELPAGIYTYSIIVDGKRLTKRMVVTK